MDSPVKACFAELVYSLLGAALCGGGGITRRTGRSELASNEVAYFMQIDSFGLSALDLYDEDGIERAEPSLPIPLATSTLLEDSAPICQLLSLKFD
jgi:hypothetical protein